MQAVLVSRVFCDHSVRYKHTHKYKKVEVLQDLFQLFLQTILSIGKSQLNYLNKFRQTQITKHETNKAHKN